MRRRRFLLLISLLAAAAGCQSVPEEFVGEPFAKVRLFFES